MLRRSVCDSRDMHHCSFRAAGIGAVFPRRMTMKAQVLHQYDPALTALSWVTMQDVPDPKIQKSNDVIVRIGGAGVCRTDLHIIEGIWRPHTDPTGTGLLPLIRLCLNLCGGGAAFLPSTVLARLGRTWRV